MKKENTLKDNRENWLINAINLMRPIIKNKGSAIFIHVAKKNYKKTEGCIAIKKIHFLKILKELRNNTKVKIVSQI